MISRTLQRGTDRITKLTLAVLAAFAVTGSISQAQTVYQITDTSGNVLSSAASLYTSSYYCYNAGGPPMPAQICIWTLRKLYGDFNAVVVVADQPHGNPPGCLYGGTQMISGGYSRSNCIVTASAAVYGH